MRSVGPWRDVYAIPKAKPVPKPKGDVRIVRERPRGAPRDRAIVEDPNGYRIQRYVTGLESQLRSAHRRISELERKLRQED